jgi:hypothetical protein
LFCFFLAVGDNGGEQQKCPGACDCVAATHDRLREGAGISWDGWVECRKNDE